MEKFKGLLVMALSVLLLAAMGCSQDTGSKQGKANKKEQIEAKQAPKESTEKERSTENVENKEEGKAETKRVQPVKGQGEMKIWFKGKATMKDEYYIVDGKTNLMPGSDLDISPNGIGVTFIGTGGRANVKENGSFHYEGRIPSDYHGTVIMKIKFETDTQTNDAVEKHYKPSFKKLKGPFVYLNEDSDEIKKVARVTLKLQSKEGKKSTATIQTPIWNKPDDYGSPKIRMKPKVTTDKDSVCIKGTSNLVEGTKIIGHIKIPGKIVMGYTNYARINPDGSFLMRISNPEEDGAEHYFVKLEVSPDHNSWPNVIKAYGEKGEKLKGALVGTLDEGGKQAEKKVKVK